MEEWEMQNYFEISLVIFMTSISKIFLTTLLMPSLGFCPKDYWDFFSGIGFKQIATVTKIFKFWFTIHKLQAE